MITGSGILVSTIFLALLISSVVTLRFERSRNDKMWMNGRQFRMIAIAQLPGSEENYLPVYKEVK